MAVKKGGLGKGIDSLITDKVKSNISHDNQGDETNKPILSLNITKVEPNREQPRKNFDEDALQELSESIKQFGILQPLLVQDKKTYFEIIAGERRWIKGQGRRAHIIELMDAIGKQSTAWKNSLIKISD